MKFEDLTPEDQQLLNTDLGEDLEKEASEKLAAASELHAYGAAHAESVADQMDEQMSKIAQEEDEDEDEEMDEESEKKAAEMGAFIERGFFDGLQKLGQERHGDPLHYYIPYIEEKVASKGAMEALEKLSASLQGPVRSGAKGLLDRMKLFSPKATAEAAGKQVKDTASKARKGFVNYHRNIKKDYEIARGKRNIVDPGVSSVPATGKEKVKAYGRVGARVSPYLAAGGGTGYLATRKKKED